MDKIYFITGTSQGLGLALAKECVNRNHTVYGLERRNSFKHALFQHILWDAHEPLNFKFPKIKVTEVELILINNAATIGEINRVSNMETGNFHEVITVNLIAVAELTQEFLKQYKAFKITIVNISSGAAKRPISSWSAYCASKAAIDMFSEVLQNEEQELGKETKVFSISPGVIDTNMQTTIRNTALSSFSSLQSFTALYTNKEKDTGLLAPNFVAHKLIEFLNANKTDEVLVRI